MIIPHSKAAIIHVPTFEVVSPDDVLKRSIIHPPTLNNVAMKRDVNQICRPVIKARYGRLIVISSPLDRK